MSASHHGGTLAEMTEDEVFGVMRRLAVNTMVARVTLQNMRQDRDERLRSQVILRGQASVRTTVCWVWCCTEAILRLQGLGGR